MTLSEAIKAVEDSQTAVISADAAQAAAQLKFDAAAAAKATSDKADTDAIAAFNASIDAAVVVFSAAKITRP